MNHVRSPFAMGASSRLYGWAVCGAFGLLLASAVAAQTTKPQHELSFVKEINLVHFSHTDVGSPCPSPASGDSTTTRRLHRWPASWLRGIG